MQTNGFKKHSVRLRNEVLFQWGFPFNSKKFSIENGFPLLRIRDICGNQKIKTFFTGNYSDDYIVKKWDMVIGMDGDFNIVKWNKEEALLNQRTMRILKKDTSKIDLGYLYYFLIPTLQKINDNTPQTTVKHLSISDISEPLFDIPDITEQEKIAEILVKIDTAIQLTESSISKQERVKKWLMQDLLTRGIDENGNIRSEETHKFKDSELGRIPEEWDIWILNNLTSLLKDWTHWTHKNVDVGIPLLSAKDILEWEIILHNDPRIISEEDYNLIHKNYVIKMGDILLTIVWTIGRVAIVKNSLPKFSLQRSVAIIRFNNDLIKEYFYYFFQSNIFLSILDLVKSTTAQSGIYLWILWSISIAFPKDRTEQERIAKILIREDAILSTKKKQLSKLQKIKSGLMQDLLTGKVRVDNLLLQ
jgi:type I restriction enzyme S subunit